MPTRVEYLTCGCVVQITEETDGRAYLKQCPGHAAAAKLARIEAAFRLWQTQTLLSRPGALWTENDGSLVDALEREFGLTQAPHDNGY